MEPFLRTPILFFEGTGGPLFLISPLADDGKDNIYCQCYISPLGDDGEIVYRASVVSQYGLYIACFFELD